MGVHVLHISDIHAVADPAALVYGREADANLRRVVDAAQTRRRRFDAVVVTGDVADDASQGAYQRVHGLLRPLGDILRWVPGNHDEPERMAEVDGDAFTSTTVGPWRVLTFDSRWPGRTPGRATAEAIERLEAELDESDGSPCVVLVHHPPRPPCEHPDCRISEGLPLLDVLDRHHDVRVVLSGHLHRSFGWVRGGTCWIGAPSTCMQVEHPHHTHTAEPPAAHVMELGDDGSVLVSAFQG
jgi:3',5'-cyclic-AMP phosphodiesterase